MRVLLVASVRLAKLAFFVTSLSRACWRCRDFPSLILTTSTSLRVLPYFHHQQPLKAIIPLTPSQPTTATAGLAAYVSPLPFPSPQQQVTCPSACVQRASGFWTPPWTRQPSAMDSKALELPRKTKDNMKENSQVLERKAQAHSKKTRGRPPVHTSLAP